jgi:hypothetical protein
MIHEWRMRGALQSFLDDELSQTRRTTLSGHLEQCVTCAATVRRLAEADRLLADVRPGAPMLSPAAARALLDRALAEAGRGRSGGRGTPFLAWGLAATLIVVASGAAAWRWRLFEATGGRRQALIGPSLPMAVANGSLYPAGEAIQPIRTPPRTAPAPRKRSSGETSTDRRASPRPPTGERRPVDPPAPPPAAGSSPGMRPRRSLPPRLRVAARPGMTLCRLPGADWWAQLSSEIEASEQSSGALAQALQAQPATDPPPVSAEPPGDSLTEPSVNSAGIEEPGSAPLLADNSNNALASTAALAGDQDPPVTAEPGVETALLPGTSPTAAAPAELLVLVTDLPAPSPVTVTQGPEAAPGYARAMAVRPDGSGGSTWTQATASSDDGLELALVMLGDGARWWE